MTDKFIAPPVAVDWVRAVGETGYEYIKDLSERVGDISDVISSLENNNLFTWNSFSRAPKKDWFFVKSANYTTAHSCLLIATAAITVTLNTTPDDQEWVRIKRETTAGPVTISGTIDGDATGYTMMANHENINLIYSRELGYWVIMQ